MSAASRKRLAILTISMFPSLRVEESSESFYNVVLKAMKQLRSISEPKLLGKLRGPDYSFNNQLVVVVISTVMHIILINSETTTE